jgi:hypothetical protein
MLSSRFSIWKRKKEQGPLGRKFDLLMADSTQWSLSVGQNWTRTQRVLFLANDSLFHKPAKS